MLSLDQILDLSIPEPNTGCWLWLGKYSSEGYGRFSANGKSYYAHRASFELSKGPIPPKKDLDHLCRVRRCINPDHLEPVTRSENFRRGMGPAAKNARMTQCKRGHPLEYPHLHIRRNGKRLCKTCAAQRLIITRRKKRMERQ